ncbi:MAG: pentapeptide repeat-containing protein [Anaerolineales bacterium]|jgi:uncharacterized protein YjbI with pentapeptide repeats|nr:pentapeptide repeat-containing protein [Anaerolineales bacterium]
MKILTQKNVQPPQFPKHMPSGLLAALEDDGEYSTLALSGCNLANSKASYLLFEQILFRRVTLGPSQHTKPRFVDCQLEASDLSGIDWEKARFRRVEFLGCRLMGAQLLDAEFEDVTFKDCNLESAVFSSAKFSAACFENCLLPDVSFESTDLCGVVFDNCDLAQADLRQARLNGTDFRSSRLGGIQVGAQELKGAIVDSTQAVQIASLIGLVVREIGEELNLKSKPA